MPLLPIPYQPVLFTPTEFLAENPHNDIEVQICPPCAGDKPYCLKIAENDFTGFQMNNVPDELDFLGNDCEFYTEVFLMFAAEFWTAEDTWTNAGDGLPWVYTPGGAPGSLQQNGGFIPVEDGWYLVNVTVSINNSESLIVKWGSTVIGTIGGVSAGVFTASFIVQAPNAVDLPQFVPTTTAFDGQIDEMSVDSIAGGWESVNWQPVEDGCGFCIIDPEEASTLILPDYLISGTGNAYYITFEVRDRTQGALLVSGADNGIDSDNSLYASGNGFYGFYFTVENGNTRISFDALDGFDGCIYNINLSVQCRNHRVLLLDGDQQNLLADISDKLLYDFNWMTLHPVKLSSRYAMEAGSCYRLVVIRDCYSDAESLIQNIDTLPWGMGANASTDGTTGYITMDGTVDPSDINYTFSGSELEIDCLRCLILDIVIFEHDGEAGAISVTIGGKPIVVDLEVLQSGLIRIHLDTEATMIPCPIQEGDKIEILYRDSEIVISEINLYYDNACYNGEDITGDFVSNCMQYLGSEDNDPCYSVIIAGMDNQPTDVLVSEVAVEKREAYGFLWGIGFHLSFREHFVFHNSRNRGGSNLYKYNNGFNKRTSGNIEKSWDVAVGHVDENLHDTIAMIQKLDWMFFGRTYLFTPYRQQLYIGLEDDYQPNWAAEAKMVTAEGKFEVARKRSSTKYGNNII